MKKESINYPQQQQHQQFQPQQPNSELNVDNGSSSLTSTVPSTTGGGRFDFDDGGVYVGGWQDGKAHGHGICTGPKGQGEYSGSFNFGFEVCGVYKWPSGAIYEGQWLNGKRHGLGVEFRGKWVYKGEWTQGYKGRYGVRASLLSSAKYEGTWANGLQDGYGSETYADGGTYQGQWLRGMRHGYGVRQSAPYGHSNVTKAALIKNSANVSMQSLDTEGESSLFDTHVSGKRDSAMRGGFVLVVKNSSSSASSRPGSAPAGSRKRHNSLEKATNVKTGFFKGLILKKQKSTGDIDVRSNRSSSSVVSSTESSPSTPGAPRKDDIDADAISNASFLSQDGDISDPSTTETYIGEWKNDKRCGFGICERSDGLRYEGEWYNNKKYGYGVTFFRDGSREEGKYKNNCLVTNAKKKHLFVLRSGKLRERIESAVAAARQAQQIALQKADIAISRTSTARGKSEQSDAVAAQSRVDSGIAYKIAKQYGGSDVTNLQQPEAPLRRRLSEFSHMRRGTRDHIAQGIGGAGGSGILGGLGGSRQYLDPNEPFGGRRGSFRTGPGSSTNLNVQGLSPHNYSYPSNQHHHSNSIQFTTGPNQSDVGNRLLPGGSHSTSSPFHPSVQHQQHSLQHNHSHPHQQNHQLRHQQQQQQMNEPDPLNDHLDHYQKLVRRYAKKSKPVVSENSFDRHRSPNLISSNRTESQVAASLDKAYGASSSADSGHESSNQSDAGLKLPQAIDMSFDSTETRTPKRTTSLYRPPTASGGGGGGSGEAGGGGLSAGPLRRKPSLQVPSAKSIKEPVMSREEVSVLSHATRMQRRQEAEMAEKLARNPLLYLVNPRFKDWLSRQQIIITVIFINITLAIIFFKLLG